MSIGMGIEIEISRNSRALAQLTTISIMLSPIELSLSSLISIDRVLRCIGITVKVSWTILLFNGLSLMCNVCNV